MNKLFHNALLYNNPLFQTENFCSMALFMDLHIIPGAALEDVLEAHKMDLGVQDKYGCKCMTFWMDESRGHVFCLIDAPSKEAVIEMHQNAHGLVPNKVVPVNSDLVNAFLGRIHDPNSIGEMNSCDIKAFYSDPAFRVLLVSHSMDTKLLSYKYGQDKARDLITLKNKIVRQQIAKFNGQEVEMEGNGFVASFIMANQAVKCAIAIQQQLHFAAEMIEFKIGLHAGVPVAESEVLFGDAVRYARHLCLFGQDCHIVFSNLINSLYKADDSRLTSKSKIRIILPEEEAFLKQLICSLSNNWKDVDFDLTKLTALLYMSNSKLYRKITAITGLSPNNFLREYRLIQSLSLLKKAENTISQTAFESGFNSPSYFAKCFQEKFGLKPLDYQKYTN